MDGSDERYAEPVSFSPVAITLGDDLEALDRADDVFIDDTLLCHGFIEALLFFSQLDSLGFFDGKRRVGVFFLRALITRIKHRLGLFFQPHAGVFQQSIIVAFSLGGVDAENALRRFVHHHLRFQRVALFLPGIEPPLFF